MADNVPGKAAKKRVEIEYMLYTKESKLAVRRWVASRMGPENLLSTDWANRSAKSWWGPNGELIIPTLEGDMTAQYGDFIIRGVEGEFYPCKPGIFAKTYDITEAY